jgi:hypothetical protein
LGDEQAEAETAGRGALLLRGKESIKQVRQRLGEDAPEDFCWSSYRATAGLMAAPEWLRLAALMPYFSEDEKWRETYAEFVRDGIATADPMWRGLRRKIFVWSEQWLESVKQHVKVSRRKADIPHDQRAAGRPAMTRIVKTIAAKRGVKTSAIQDEHGGLWRELAACLGGHEGMRRLRVIAQTLRLRSCSRDPTGAVMRAEIADRRRVA